MANPTDIPAPLSDRTLAHGRNVMAVASVIMVLAWVPYIEITSFKPLGFDIKEGGELSVWGILAAVLFYYAIRFCADCWTDYNGWRDTYRGHFSAPLRERSQDEMFNSHARRLNRKFWFFDVAPPAVMLLLALVAAYQQVVPLVIPPTPPASPLSAAVTTTPQFITIAGLAFDILGIVLMAVFYSPKFFKPDFMPLENQRPSVEWYTRNQKWLWWIGPALIAFGFLLQIIGNLAEDF